MPENSVDLLMSHLGRARRRLAVIALARYGAVVAGLAIVAAEAVAMAIPVGASARPLWAVAAGLVTAVAAVTLVLLRAPTLAVTATIVDRRWNLADRATTALEVGGHGDTMSKLVLADAIARLAEHSPSELRYGPVHRLPAAVAVVAAVSVLLLVRGGSTAASSASGSTVLSGVGTTAAPPRGAGQDQARAQEAAAASRSAAAGTSRPADPRGAESALERAADARASQPEQPSTSSETDAQSEGSAPASRAGAPAGHADAARSEAGAGASHGDAPRSDRGVAGAEQSGPGAHGAGSGGSSTAGTGTAVGAGGAQGGQLRGSAVERARSGAPVDSAAFAARYRSASAQVESAIAQERIPAQRRTYVRDYFLAIRPAEQP